LQQNEGLFVMETQVVDAVLGTTEEVEVPAPPTCERCHESCETCEGGNTEFDCVFEQCKMNGCDIFHPTFRTWDPTTQDYTGAFSSDYFQN